VQIVSTNPNEFGLLAVGQEAWGFVAIGQMARGVLVLGQLAVGVAGVGQCCACIWGVGQVGLGVAWFGAMIGVGGRGFGGVLRLIPGLDPPRLAPPEVPLEAVLAGGAAGHVKLDVVGSPDGPRLARGGQALPIKLTPEVAGALGANAPQLPQVFARVRRHGPVVLCDQLVEVPGVRRTAGASGWLLAARLATLVAIATAWWFLFVELVLFPG
jgi:hypothetical protein